MSFLNPVSEPVKRFKSTDAGAPQINYNSRAAGDIKAVLKSCLITGYGAIPSAGWSAVNEVANVIEFVSPSAAMSDYRLGIDDSLTNKTSWYYQYQNAKVSPSYNAPIKVFENINATHASNGWQLLVTPQGILFIELVFSTLVNKLSSRITYFSKAKSSLISSTGANIVFFSTGHNSAIPEPKSLYASGFPHIKISSYDTSTARIFSASPFSFGIETYTFGVSNVDLVTSLYIIPTTNNFVVGEVVGLLIKTVNNAADLYGVSEITVGGRPAISFCCGISYANSDASMLAYARTFVSYLDYWEY